jgi:hypothetical protein
MLSCENCFEFHFLLGFEIGERSCAMERSVSNCCFVVITFFIISMFFLFNNNSAEIAESAVERGNQAIKVWFV